MTMNIHVKNIHKIFVGIGFISLSYILRREWNY